MRIVLETLLKRHLTTKIKDYTVEGGCVHIDYKDGSHGRGKMGNNQSKLVINTNKGIVYTYYKDKNKGVVKHIDTGYNDDVGYTGCLMEKIRNIK